MRNSISVSDMIPEIYEIINILLNIRKGSEKSRQLDIVLYTSLLLCLNGFGYRCGRELFGATYLRYHTFSVIIQTVYKLQNELIQCRSRLGTH